MKKLLQTTTAMLAAGLMLWAGTARASESRMDALLYNMAFEDATDVFLYPQRAPYYSMITLYMPKAINQVYGGFIYSWGKNAFGIFIHRPYADTFNQYRLWGLNTAPFNKIMPNLSPITGNKQSLSYPAGQIFDVMWGNKRVGIDLRLYGQAKTHVSQGDADTVAPGTTFGTDLNVGISANRNLWGHIDIGVAHVSNNGTYFDANIGGRYLRHSAARVNPLFAFEVQFGLFSPSSGSSSYFLGVPLKTGVRAELVKDKLFAGILGGLDIQVGKVSGGSTAFALVVPTVEIGTEYYALSWLTLRAGIKGGWGIQFSGANGQHPSSTQLAYNTGVGFKFWNFNLDVTLDYSLWQNGLYFLSGNKGLFGNATLTYNF